MPLANGEVFAGFRILRLLGSGGMGEVYLIQHPRLPRRDALKILPAELSAGGGWRSSVTPLPRSSCGLCLRWPLRREPSE
jgi:serine/threonine protein kinase, bacterial